MKFSQYRHIFFLLLLLVLLISACGIGRSDDQDEGPEPDLAASSETPLFIQSGEIVNGDLGAQMDDYITRDKPLFSGSILVAQEGEILLSKGFNYSNWELKSPNSAQTKYRISSITKPFTAILVMKLVESGQIGLDDPLCNYLPDCPQAWERIRIENLLNHTSGLPEYTSGAGAAAEARDPHSVSRLIETFREAALDFPPGESYSYSNSNYILLGALIEQVTGTRYETFLQRTILVPLEIENSGIDDPERILDQRAAGYQIKGNFLVNAPYLDMSNAYATAGMYSTVGDLFVFDQALKAGELLSPETQEMMYSPHFAADGSGGGYGLGWQLSQSGGHRIVGHAGGINGFRTYLGRYLDDGVTIILLSNIETEEIEEIVTGLEQIIFNQN